MDMAGLVEDALAALDGQMGASNLPMTLEDVLEMDHLARGRTGDLARRLAGGN